MARDAIEKAGEESMPPPGRVQSAGSDDPPPPLHVIYLYLTNECNQRCSHCWINPSLEGRYRGEQPSLDDYRRFIDASLPLGLKFVKLTGGEPLLRDETYPLIEYLSQLGISTTLETNGMLIGRKEAEFLKEHQVVVSVSLDGATAAVHERRRGLEGAFERTWSALEVMTELGIPVTVVTAVSHSNREEVPEILELLRGLKKDAPLGFKVNPVIPVGRGRKLARQGETLAPDELVDLAAVVSGDLMPRYKDYGIEVMLQLEVSFFSIDDLASGGGQGGVYHCRFLNLLSVLADGSITLCGIGYEAPELTMGNIREPYDLPALWENHDTLTGVRFTVHHALQGVCGDCLFQRMCLGGCRASALAVGGSLAASPPSCQALYDAGLFAASRLREPAASRYAAVAPGLRAKHQVDPRGRPSQSEPELS